LEERRPLLSLPEVGELLGKDQRTIRRWANLHSQADGQLGVPCIQITPRLQMLSRAGLDAWLLGQRPPAATLEDFEAPDAGVILLRQAN